MSKGKVISQDTKHLVRTFFESPEISRICPGVKDCFRIKNEEGIKETVKKQLVLMNLKEAFALYKADPNNPNIGFSSFASLRPRNCVLAGAAGTHSVCVCTYHQNVKLQFSSLGIKQVNYKSLFENSVCDINNRNYMLQICKSCPKDQGVKDFLMSFESVMDREYDNIKYKQWVSTDRCNLVEKVKLLDQFIDFLCKNAVKLTHHHYIAKKQSEFLKDLKKTMSYDTIIIVGDFSENYAYVVQDAAQEFHWENSQCTVHPFVVYFKDIETNECKHASYCFLSPNTNHNATIVYTFF